jgi:hypothetical protein
VKEDLLKGACNLKLKKKKKLQPNNSKQQIRKMMNAHFLPENIHRQIKRASIDKSQEIFNNF